MRSQGSSTVFSFKRPGVLTIAKILFSFRHRNPATGKLSVKHLRNPPRSLNTDLTTLYTLRINPDNSFEILVNGESVRKGNLLEDFEPSVNPPPLIDDPRDTKPAWWDDREMYFLGDLKIFTSFL